MAGKPGGQEWRIGPADRTGGQDCGQEWCAGMEGREGGQELRESDELSLRQPQLLFENRKDRMKGTAVKNAIHTNFSILAGVKWRIFLQYDPGSL
jgi:hypothetical protein